MNGRDNDQNPKAVPPGAGTSRIGGSDHLRPLPTSNGRVADDMGTGEEFQNKMEDDLYEGRPLSKDPTFDKWTSRIAWGGFLVALLWFLFLACYAGWRWVN